MVTPEERTIRYALKLKFLEMNNEVKYKTLIAGLKIAKELRVIALHVFSDSRLLVCQVNKKFQAKKGDLPLI